MPPHSEAPRQGQSLTPRAPIVRDEVYRVTSRVAKPTTQGHEPPPARPLDIAQEYQREVEAGKQADVASLGLIYDTVAYPNAHRPEDIPSGTEPLVSADGGIFWRGADPLTGEDLDNIYDFRRRVTQQVAHRLEEPDVNPCDVLELGDGGWWSARSKFLDRFERDAHSRSWPSSRRLCPRPENLCNRPGPLA